MHRSRRSPLPRLLAVAASIAAVLWLLYLIVGNLVLVGWLERRLSARPAERQLELDSAWTIFPGRVHVRGFRFRHADEDVQLELAFARATIEVELFSLTRRVLYVRRLDADGMSLRFRRLLDDPRVHPLRLRALPTFEGLPGEPRARPEEPERADASELWSLHVEGIDVRLRELWMDEFRYEGSGRVQGAFWFAPDREIEVLDSRVELGAAPLGFGRVQPIATRVEGAIDGRLARLDVSDDAPRGWGVFRHLTLHGQLDADVAGLAWSSAYFPRGPAIERGAGSLALSLHVDRGRFTRRSHVRYATRELVVRKGGLAARGDAELLLGVEGTAGRLHLTGSQIVLSPFGEVRGFELGLRGDATDLARRWRTTGGKLRIERAFVPDLAALGSLGRRGRVRFHGGSLQGRFAAGLDGRGRVEGELDVRGRGVQVSFGDVRVHGSGHAGTRFVQQRLLRPSGTLRDAKLELAHFSFATPHGASGPGELSAHASRVDVSAGKPRRFAVAFSAAFSEADGVLDALEVADGGLAKLARAFVDLEDLRVRGSVQRDDDRFVVHLARARTDGVDVAGTVAPDKPTRGRFSVDLGLLEFDVEVEP